LIAFFFKFVKKLEDKLKLIDSKDKTQL